MSTQEKLTGIFQESISPATINKPAKTLPKTRPVKFDKLLGQDSKKLVKPKQLAKPSRREWVKPITVDEKWVPLGDRSDRSKKRTMKAFQKASGKSKLAPLGKRIKDFAKKDRAKKTANTPQQLKRRIASAFTKGKREVAKAIDPMHSQRSKFMKDHTAYMKARRQFKERNK